MQTLECHGTFIYPKVHCCHFQEFKTKGIFFRVLFLGIIKISTCSLEHSKYSVRRAIFVQFQMHPFIEDFFLFRHIHYVDLIFCFQNSFSIFGIRFLYLLVWVDMKKISSFSGRLLYIQYIMESDRFDILGCQSNPNGRS